MEKCEEGFDYCDILVYATCLIPHLTGYYPLGMFHDEWLLTYKPNVASCIFLSSVAVLISDFSSKNKSCRNYFIHIPLYFTICSCATSLSLRIIWLPLTCTMKRFLDLALAYIMGMGKPCFMTSLAAAICKSYAMRALLENLIAASLLLTCLIATKKLSTDFIGVKKKTLRFSLPPAEAPCPPKAEPPCACPQCATPLCSCAAAHPH